MSSDESDKTVFQPSVRPGGGGAQPPTDSTIMRPTPGRGAGRPQPGGQPGRQAPQRPAAPINQEAAQFQVSHGLNPIINAASALIAVMEKTRGSMSHPNIGGLHQRLTTEIRNFEQKLRDLGYAPEIVMSARYIMCSVLDETVLHTPWGSESAWAQRTLLSVFHNEASGGEKFFLILDRMRQAPGDNLYMIELQYVCLSMGFEGKYRLMSRGRDALEQVRDELFNLIRRYRGEYERSLSDKWQGLGKTRNTLTHYLPMWVITVIALSVVFFSFSGFRWWLYESSTPVATQLQNISDTAVEEIQEEKEKNAR